MTTPQALDIVGIAVDGVSRETLIAIAKTLSAEVRRLQHENERLRGWIRVEGGCNNTCTRQILGEVCHGCKCGKTIPEPAP